ncbi:TRAP transporter large permease protein OS=Castellaniella defragrans OX=75697 GN=HNR28_001078 PE=3 SV=1 [Castellaniella defragrans]
MTLSVLIIGLGVIAFTGLPVGIGLGLVALVLMHWGLGGAEELAVTAAWNVLSDFTLSAVPIFIFMGEVLLLSGVSTRMYNALAPWFNRVPGKLLHTNIVVSAVFGAVSGASTSTAAAVGAVAYPELRDRGYERKFAVGTLAAGGTLGLLIPPSLSLLLYGATQNVSIGRLFLAGVGPGIMLAILFMGIIGWMCKRNPGLVGRPEERYIRMSTGEKLRGLLGIWPVAFIAFAVLGTLYLGVATPTEAAGLGVATALVTGFCWRTLTLRRAWEAFKNATKVFAMIAVILLGAVMLAQALAAMGVPQSITSWMVEFKLGRYGVLTAVIILYLVLGCFFDGISLLLMTIPIIFPVLMQQGFDPVWSGVIITILIEVGMLTPPVGMNLFVLTSITKGEVTLVDAARATLPFWLFMLVGIAILCAIPGIALWLPNMVMG